MVIDIREAVAVLIETKPWEAVAVLILLAVALVEAAVEVAKDFLYYYDEDDDTRLTGDHTGSR